MNSRKNVLTKRFLPIATILLVCGVCVWFFAGRSKSEIKHVILISMDTTRWDALGCYDGPLARTPVIDAFAAEGVLFEHAISPLPYTLPAHSSMLTGEIPPAHKVLDNTYYKLEDDEVTLAERLKAQGFVTAAFVSSFILDSQFGLDQGFDHYDDTLGDKKTAGDGGINERRGDATTARAIKWLGKHKDEKNFLFVHYYDPHMAYDPPEPYTSRFRYLPAGQQRELLAYAGEVEFVDHCIGQIIEKLKELGLYENTLICITADHGDSHWQHEEISHGYFAYNATTQVPLIFRIPNVKGPLRVKNHVGIIDIVPTICSLLGIPISETIQGRDLAPYWTGKQDPYPGRSIFTQANDAMKYGGNSLLGIISGDYKYIQTTRPELYNLAKDPQELHNIAANEPQRARILQDTLKQLLDDISTGGEGGNVELDPETVKRLESLGYLGTTKGMKDAFAFDQTKEDPKDLIDYHIMTDRVGTLIRTKELEQAKILCEEYIAMRPDFHLGYSAMAEILRESGDYPNALAYLKKRAELDPDNKTIYRDFISVYEAMGDFEGVRENALKLLEVNSNDLPAYYYLAISNFERGSYELPENNYTDEMKNTVFYSKMSISLADKLLEKKQFKRAFDLYHENLERRNNSEYLLNTLGWMAATSAIEGVYNPKQALEYALRVCELDDYHKPELLDTLAVAYAANGDFSNATKTAEKAAALATQEGNKGLAQQIQNRLRLFQSGKQYYDPGLK